MTIPSTCGRCIPARTLKSPLAAPDHATQADVVTAASALAAYVQSPLTDRESTLAEFEGYLRTVNNRDGRPTRRRRSASTRSRPIYCVPAGLPDEGECVAEAERERVFGGEDVLEGESMLPYALFKVVKSVAVPHHFRVAMKNFSREECLIDSLPDIECRLKRRIRFIKIFLQPYLVDFPVFHFIIRQIISPSSSQESDTKGGSLELPSSKSARSRR